MRWLLRFLRNRYAAWQARLEEAREPAPLLPTEAAQTELETHPLNDDDPSHDAEIPVV